MSEATQIHFNARVRGMKSLLFSRAELEEMLNQGDLQRMIERLLDSPYRTDMAEALTRFHGPDAIEETVSRNLVGTFQGLIRRSQGEFRTLVEMFLERWDLMAVKSLIRSKHHNLDAVETAASLLPGPRMTVPLLQELAGRDSMETVITSLVGWNPSLCKGLLRVLPAYREHHDLSLLEDALDREYFVRHARALGENGTPDTEALRHYLRMEIDRINLRTVLQHAALPGESPLDEDRLLIRGYLTLPLLKEMAVENDLAGAVERLGNTTYAALVNELYPLMQTRRVSPVERYIERMIMHEIRRLARQDVFGLGVVMDFVWLKYNEVVNLRLIARGLSGHLPVGRVREELYFV